MRSIFCALRALLGVVILTTMSTGVQAQVGGGKISLEGLSAITAPESSAIGSVLEISAAEQAAGEAGEEEKAEVKHAAWSEEAYSDCAECSDGACCGSCDSGSCGETCGCGEICGCGDDCGCGDTCGCGDSCGCCDTGGLELSKFLCRKGQVYLFGEFLYLAPADADLTHAQQQNGIGGAGTVPFGEIGTIGFSYEPAFRVGGGFQLDKTSSVATSYTNFQAESLDFLDIPVIVGGGGAIGSLVHLPEAALTASTGPVTATYEIDFQIADVVFRDVLKQGCGYQVRYLLGAQYGNLNQEFSQNGVFGGGAGGTIDTTTDIEFDGGGLKVGVEGERFIHKNVMIYGRANAAAMIGRFNAEYTLLNSTTDVLLGNAVWTDDRFVTQVELELGVAVTALDDQLRLSAGFLSQHWDDVVTTDEFIEAVQTNNYVDLNGELSFNGLVGRIEYAW